MKTNLLVLHLVFNFVVLRCATANESADASAPQRFSEIIKTADYVVLAFREYDHPQEVKIADRRFLEEIARVFADATYFPREHSLSVSLSLFVFTPR